MLHPHRIALYCLTAAITFGGLGGLVSLAASSVEAPPKPSKRDVKWSLNFTPGELRLYTDPVDGLHYWFFTYKVVNKTGEDRLWAPNFTLFTDTGDIVKAGADVPSHVTEDLLTVMGNDLLEKQFEAIGDLLQGERHAKEGLIVWPASKTTVNEMRMFVGGLSGETARVRNPLTDEEIILRKTMVRDYLAAGDMLARGTKPVELLEESWVMR